MTKHIVKKVIGGIFLGTLAVLVFGFGTMYLWNWLVPALFAGPLIGFWQAIGLVVLSKILFGGMRFRRRGGWGHRGHYWKQNWENMTEDERQKMRDKLEGWCGKRYKVTMETPAKE